MINIVLALGLLDGLVFGAFTSLLPLLNPALFVQDAAVWPHMAQVAPQAFLSMFFCGVDIAASACLVAQNQLNYMARSFMYTLGITAAYMYFCRAYAWGLPGIWNGIAFFFFVRTVQSVARILWVTYIKQPDAKKQEPPSSQPPLQQPAPA